LQYTAQPLAREGQLNEMQKTVIMRHVPRKRSSLTLQEQKVA